MMACKDAKNLSSDQAYRQVYEFETSNAFEKDEAGCWVCNSVSYYVSSACNHCENPACVAACPVQSMQKHEETGLVYNDHETCIGCGACALACPYGAPQINAEISKSIKCDGCHERVEKGELPVCVAACTQRALEFGDIEELRAKHPEAVAAIAPLPDPAMTNPSVVINAPACAVAWEDAASGMVVNTLELRA